MSDVRDPSPPAGLLAAATQHDRADRSASGSRSAQTGSGWLLGAEHRGAARASVLAAAWLIGLIGSLGVLAGVAGAQQVRVAHIDGPDVAGQVQGIESRRAPGETVETRVLVLSGVEPDGRSEFDLERIEEIAYVGQADPEAIPEEFPLTLHLTSGDRLTGRVVESLGGGLVFESMSFGRLPIDLSMIRQIDVRSNQAERPFEAALEVADSGRDALYFMPEDAEQEAVDVAIGDLETVEPDGVFFLDVNELLFDLVPWSNIQAITRPFEVETQPETFQTILLARNGERFTGRLTAYEDGRFALRSLLLFPETEDEQVAPERHADGLTIGISESRVLQMTFRYGKFAYLSDQEPSAIDEYPFFGGRDAVPEDESAYWWRYRVNRAVDGSPLQLRDERGREVTYETGLGVHSYSSLTFRLDGEYAVLLADIGLDSSAGEQASVVFEVWVDDETEPRFQSDVFRRATPLRAIEIDVRGAEAVRLVVDFADHGDIQDRANWAKVRVLKPSARD